MYSDEEKELIAKCEAWGSDKVRHLLATNRLGDSGSPRASIAQSWLDRFGRAEAASAATVQEALARSQAAAARDAADASSEQVSVAREANEIAREAITKAETANTIATAAIIIAMIAIAVTIVGLFVGHE